MWDWGLVGWERGSVLLMYSCFVCHYDCRGVWLCTASTTFTAKGRCLGLAWELNISRVWLCG